MKKLLALILSLVMAFSITACSKDNDDHKSSDKSSTKDEVSSKKDADDSDDVDDKDANKKSSKDKNDDEDDSSEQPGKLCMGTVNGNIYENELVGIRFEADEGWVYMSQKDLMNLEDVVSDVVGEEYEARHEQATVFYDMYASHIEGIGHISVSFEKVDEDLLEYLDLKTLTELNLPFIVESYENMGYEDVNYSLTEISVDGKNFPCLLLSFSMNGITFIMKSLSIKCDGYLANVSCAAVSKQILQQILDNITWI